MIRTLRILFLARPAREKFLILALVVMAALLWLSAYSGRLGRFLTEEKHTTEELTDQARWLAHSDAIAKQAHAEASRLDPSRTLDGSRLSAAMAALANEHNLTFTTSDTQDVPGGQFVIHTLQINLTQAAWENFVPFYQALEGKAPYISIESLSIASNKANPAQLNASVRVSSVEIRR